MESHAVLDERDLQSWALPVVLKQGVQREVDVLRLALVEQLHKSCELLVVQTLLKHMRWHLEVLDLTEALKHLLPV